VKFSASTDGPTKGTQSSGGRSAGSSGGGRDGKDAANDFGKRSVDLEFFDSPEAKGEGGVPRIDGSVSPVWRVSHDGSRENSPENPSLSVTRGRRAVQPSPKSSPEVSPAKKR
jgi:hypothetical protein